MRDLHYWLVLSVLAVWESYWIVSARGVKRAASKEPLWSRLPVVAGILLSICLLLAPDWLGSFFTRSFTDHGDLSYYLGLAIAVGGVVFAFWARHTLGRNWSGRVTIKEDHELVTRGPYAWVRHPIYTGALMAFGGSALALGWIGGLCALAIMAAIFTRKMLLEEQVLVGHFGDKYLEYKRRTKALIPFLA